MQTINTKYEVTVEGEVNVRGEMFSEIAELNEQNELALIEQTIQDLSLSSGNITYERNSFYVAGKTKSGNQIMLIQDGEFGPGLDNKMGKISVMVNGEDISNAVILEFTRWFGGGITEQDEVDLSRTDIWASIIK